MTDESENKSLTRAETEELVHQVQTDEDVPRAAEAFDRLCNSYYAPLCAHIRGKLFAMPSSAEDVAQQVWFNVWLNLRSKLNTEGNPQEEGKGKVPLYDHKQVPPFNPKIAQFYTYVLNFFTKKAIDSCIRDFKRKIPEVNATEYDAPDGERRESFIGRVEDPHSEDDLHIQISDLPNPPPVIKGQEKLAGSNDEWPEINEACLKDDSMLRWRFKSASNPIDLWISTLFEARTVSSSENEPPDNHLSRSSLIQIFNDLISGPCIHNADRFQGIPLRSETEILLHQNPKGIELKKLNRMLIEDAYPREIARQEKDDERVVCAKYKAEMVERSLETLYRLIFAEGGYPHEILTFCCCKIISGVPSKRGLETKMSEIDQKYGPLSLDNVAMAFAKDFTNQAHLNKRDRGLLADWMAPLTGDLEKSFRFLAENRSPRDEDSLQDAPPKLLRSLTGQSCMRDYRLDDTKSINKYMSAWCFEVARRIRDLLGIDRNEHYVDKLLSEVGKKNIQY